MGKHQVAVIGAGISGLACGRTLQDAGAGVVVFEKSRSLGGRLATRRWEGHVVDHGAPWFASLPAEVRHRGQEALRCIEVPVRHAGSGEAIPEPSGGRWYLPEGNNRLGKALAGELDVRMEVLTESIGQQADSRWQVAGEIFDDVVLTAPWPQTRALLAPWLGGAATTAEPRYARTLTAFFEYAGNPVGLAAAWSGMEHRDGESGLARSICENHKPGRVQPGRTVIVAHGTPDFSQENFDAERAGWAAQLELAVRRAWGLPAEANAVFAHRWGFSVVDQPFTDVPDLPRGIHLAGDMVGGPAIGAVYQSGVAAARAVLAADQSHPR